MIADIANVVYGKDMREELHIKFDEDTAEDIIFFGVLETLELAAKSEVGPAWPGGNNAKFSTSKEIVSQLSYKLSNSEECASVTDTSVYSFSGESKYSKEFSSHLTSYELGVRVAAPTTIDDIADHHIDKVFEHFKSAHPDVIDTVAGVESVEDFYPDTLDDEENEYNFDVPLMRDAMEAILNVTDEPVATWESIAYEVDEAQLLIALILKRGYAVGDTEIVISEYDSSGEFVSLCYAHDPQIDGHKTEFVAVPMGSEEDLELNPDSFDADALLFEIDFSRIARKIVSEDDILTQPMYVHAKNLLAILKRYKQPYLEVDKK